ncbi:MAG: hypothetical protein P1P88_10750 [Bacteroidales bacterium]|nr:hypothetical protein [Bacteroidales bacterium]
MKHLLLFSLTFLFLSGFSISKAQRWTVVKKNNDTISYTASQIVITKDTVYFSPKDTVVILTKHTRYRIRKNPIKRSDVFYDSLRVKSYRNKVTEELFRLVFKTAPIEVHDTSNFNRSEDVFIPNQGLIIKSISLKQIDIIEGSIHDTLVRAQSILAKGANELHMNTAKNIILNNLTFKKGDLVDANQLADNERILRRTPYLEDARIHVIPNKQDSTQADIVIYTKDEFSIGIGSDYNSVDNFKLTLYDKNFMGIGHDMRHSLIYRSGYEPQYGYGFRYSVNNISRSFISARIEYENSWDRRLKLIAFNKEFISPETKYAGGLALYDLTDNREYAENDSNWFVPYRAILQDYWIGRAFPLSDKDRTRINVSFRYTNSNFLNRPEVNQDSNFFYHDRNLYLAEFSIIKRNFYKSSLVMGFGITEDIPYGYVFKITTGFDRDEFFNRPYFGGGVAIAKHYKWPGYFLLDFSAGSFYSADSLQDGVVKIELLNIGNLHRFNRYSIRNFINIKFQYGINLTDPESKANLNNRWTSIASGLNKEGLKGTQKLSLNLESALFTPWYLLGFKFSLFTFSDMGWISPEKKLGKNLSYYASLGAGLRIKNESWIFETITLGFAYFVRAPEGSGRMGFLFNAADPRLFNNLNPDKPDVIRMDQSPGLFTY